MLTGTLLHLTPIGSLLTVLGLLCWATGIGAAAPACRWPAFLGIKLDLMPLGPLQPIAGLLRLIAWKLTVTGYDTMLGAGGGCHEITRRLSWMTTASSGDHRKAPPRPVNRGETPAANDEMFKASA